MYDLIILGGGPAGYAAAIAAGRKAKRVAVFEGETVGGTCLNVGCIPTKYLLDKGSLVERIRDLTISGFFKGAGQFSYSRIIRGKDEVVKKLTEGVAGLLKRHKVDLIKGFAELASPGVVMCGGKKYQAENILVATGSAPWSPPIPGIELAQNSTQMLAETKVPKRLVVIGGGVIGIELASAMKAFGSRVIVLEMMPELFPGEERDIISLVVSHLKQTGVDVRTGAKVTGITKVGMEKQITWEQKGKTETVAADCVLAASGRKARLTGIDTAALGLKIDNKGNLAVDKRMRTSVPKIYAAGDVAGGWQLAHSAYYEAECAVEDMFGAGFDADQTVMPRCVYTLPPFAAVGMTKNQIHAVGMECNVGRFPFAACGMALAEDAPEGMAMVLSDKKTGKILGAHLFGASTHELIPTAAMAIAAGVTVHQWEKIITPHPSLSETLQEAALAGLGLARHIP